MEQIRKISINDNDYPELLKQIANPPKFLYFKGTLPKPDELCFAIVGTRLCSSYGKQAVLEITSQLANNGIIIVSGLAPGIDTFSHMAALENKKRVIAVLGTGIDEQSIYPKENIPLARKIVENNGCIISEYPPGTRATHFTFPQRNRIISGLSLGTLVVEAKEKSGSLITANCAFSQKRKVFAVPGPIYSLNSKGTNLLIKKGAKLVNSALDILQELGISQKYFVKNNNESKSMEEKIILSLLQEEPLYIDKIIEKSKLNASQVASLITQLEIKSKVRNLGGNVFGLI